MNAPTCKATTKNYPRCPLAAIRLGYCSHHQPEERLARLRHKKARLDAQVDNIQAKIESLELELLGHFPP